MSRIKVGRPWFRWRGSFPRLFLNESHEPKIKWILRFTSGLSIGVSFITLPWYWAFGITTAIVFLDWYLEATAYYYTSLYINAMPDFEWQGEKWLAMTFMFVGAPPEDPKSQKIVGMVFSDRDYAKQVYSMILAWNDEEPDNRDGSVKLSFVVEDERYYAFIYPDPRKKMIRAAHARIEESNKLRMFGKEHFGLVMTMTLCKGFSTSNFALRLFAENHVSGEPFTFGPFSMGDAEPEPLFEVEPMTFYEFKYMHYSELTADDYEYHYWQRIINRAR